MACAPYSGCLSVWQQAGNRQATNKPNYSRAEQEAVVSLLDWCQAALLAAIACCMPLALRHGPANVTPLAWASASACARRWDWEWAREALRFWHLAIYMGSLQFVLSLRLPLSLTLFSFFTLLFFNARRSKVFATRVFWQSFKPHVVARFERGRSKVVFGPITIEGLQCI